MSENTMPKRLWIQCPDSRGEFYGVKYADDNDTEYIRADVAQAQLDAANARIAELEAAQAWVSVHERLPEPLDDVIVADVHGDGATLSVGWYLSSSASWYVNEWSGITVTHWMPIPPPPVTP